MLIYCSVIALSFPSGLLSKAMDSLPGNKFLVDGFPRKYDQCLDFEAQLQPCDHALVFSVPEEEARRRLLDRGATSG